MDKTYKDVKTLVVRMPVEVGTDVGWDGQTYELFCGEGVDEWKQKFSSVYDDDSYEIVLEIDVATGRINNYPEDADGDFTTVKVVDTGSYFLLDADDNEICSYDGYVPECLDTERDGFGDYMEFFVTKGVIDDWKWNKELFDNIVEECNC